jgi:uncharacterized protein with HEPN domain
VNDDRLYLVHIQECIGWIRTFTRHSRDEFLTDRKTQDAVLRNLQTMAASTQQLSDAAKARRPEVQWRQIAAFRNVLTHNYLGIDLTRIWDTIENDLPALAEAVASLLADTRTTE